MIVCRINVVKQNIGLVWGLVLIQRNLVFEFLNPSTLSIRPPIPPTQLCPNLAPPRYRPENPDIGGNFYEVFFVNFCLCLTTFINEKCFDF